MTSQGRSAKAGNTEPPLPRRLKLFGGVLITVYLVILALLWARGLWLTEGAGRRYTIDFVVFQAAGEFAIKGDAATAYDLTTLATTEWQIAGEHLHALPWVYPPIFFFAVAPIALLPFVPAFFAWLGVTLAAYLGAIAAIVPRRMMALFALASPAVFWNLLTGQNGLLTAALFGASLAFLEERPLLAGIFLGLLSYKPQFGLLFPLVLLLTGEWRVIASAVATVALLAAASYGIFGADAWQVFLRSGSLIANAEFNGAFFPWTNLQTYYGLVRWLGADASTAWTIHGVLALAATAIVCWIWRQRVDFAVKAAALSAGTLVAMPYLLIHDFAAASVPAAFLIKKGLAGGFMRGELLILIGTMVVFVAPVLALHLFPVGPLVATVLLGLSFWRALQQRPLAASTGA